MCRVNLNPTTRNLKLAARLGFEPRQTDSESAVLPLHNRASDWAVSLVTPFGESSRGWVNIRLLAMIGWILLISSAGASETNAALILAEEKLKVAFADVQPAPAFAVIESGKILDVSYLTQKFLVHRTDKTGEWFTNMVEQIGPGARGLHLTVRCLGPDDARGARVLLQKHTRQEPYWITDYEIFQILVDGKPISVECAIATGRRTSKELVEKVRSALSGIAVENKKPTATKD